MWGGRGRRPVFRCSGFARYFGVRALHGISVFNRLFSLTPLPPSPSDFATLHFPSAFAKAMADKSAFAKAMADKSAGLGSITNQMGEGSSNSG